MQALRSTTHYGEGRGYCLGVQPAQYFLMRGIRYFVLTSAPSPALTYTTCRLMELSRDDAPLVSGGSFSRRLPLPVLQQQVQLQQALLLQQQQQQALLLQQQQQQQQQPMRTSSTSVTGQLDVSGCVGRLLYLVLSVCAYVCARTHACRQRPSMPRSLQQIMWLAVPLAAG